MTESCPLCNSSAGSVSSSLTPEQYVCVNTDCEVVSWRADRTEENE